ncbi:hypothetical protein PDJAM_G00191060 [Pangasius djambal]|uniref:Uncharacterized protein n=1 Tax=Pangasius djambal TaxID=1691987 RepID=A0ACC5Y7B0_9TELE|nr:hypothetical protein [Pangasius djambal]
MSSAAIANGGGVAAGSLVAVLQSVGAAGLSAATTAGVASTGGVIGGVLGWLSGHRDGGEPHKSPQPPNSLQPPNLPESTKLSVPEPGNSSETDDDEDKDPSNDPPSKELQKSE